MVFLEFVGEEMKNSPIFHKVLLECAPITKDKQENKKTKLNNSCNMSIPQGMISSQRHDWEF